MGLLVCWEFSKGRTRQSCQARCGSSDFSQEAGPVDLVERVSRSVVKRHRSSLAEWQLSHGLMEWTMALHPLWGASPSYDGCRWRVMSLVPGPSQSFTDCHWQVLAIFLLQHLEQGTASSSLNHGTIRLPSPLRKKARASSNEELSDLATSSEQAAGRLVEHGCLCLGQLHLPPQGCGSFASLLEVVFRVG